MRRSLVFAPVRPRRVNFKWPHSFQQCSRGYCSYQKLKKLANSSTERQKAIFVFNSSMSEALRLYSHIHDFTVSNSVLDAIS
jgi:hypothetical protein